MFGLAEHLSHLMMCQQFMSMKESLWLCVMNMLLLMQCNCHQSSDLDQCCDLKLMQPHCDWFFDRLFWSIILIDHLMWLSDWLLQSIIFINHLDRIKSLSWLIIFIVHAICVLIMWISSLLIRGHLCGGHCNQTCFISCINVWFLELVWALLCEQLLCLLESILQSSWKKWNQQQCWIDVKDDQETLSWGYMIWIVIQRTVHLKNLLIEKYSIICLIVLDLVRTKQSWWPKPFLLNFMLCSNGGYKL